MRELFGTDGVRGVANTELTPELAFKLGKFGAYVLTSHKSHKARIIIGRDTRISGDLLESALVSGILSVGCDALCIGVIPTPGVSYLTRKLGADAGVVISASHNPVEFNGIKFFNDLGFKLSDEMEEEIEDYIFGRRAIPVELSGGDIGRKEEHLEGNKLYSDFVKSTIDMDLKSMKIAVDCANGAASAVAISTLEDMGADIFSIHNKPNGLNINHNCGSTHPEDLKHLVVSNEAHVGLAFDGDADRLIVIDEMGEEVDGDKIMLICGKRLNQEGKLAKNTIVSTVMSNIGFDVALKENEMASVRTQVGDRYVLEEMRKNGYTLGGEQSGHVIFLEHNTTGDGLLTALQLLATLKMSGQTMSELGRMMKVYPQILLNAKVSNKNKHSYMENENVKARIEEIEGVMSGEGRVLIRPSGTEPLVRVMLEGKNQEELEAYAKELVALIEKELK